MRDRLVDRQGHSSDWKIGNRWTTGYENRKKAWGHLVGGRSMTGDGSGGKQDRKAWQVQSPKQKSPEIDRDIDVFFFMM